MDLSLQIQIHELLSQSLSKQEDILSTHDSDPHFACLYSSFVDNLESHWSTYQDDPTFASMQFFKAQFMRQERFPRQFSVLMKLWGRVGYEPAGQIISAFAHRLTPLMDVIHHKAQTHSTERSSEEGNESEEHDSSSDDKLVMQNTVIAIGHFATLDTVKLVMDRSGILDVLINVITCHATVDKRMTGLACKALNNCIYGQWDAKRIVFEIGFAGILALFKTDETARHLDPDCPIKLSIALWKHASLLLRTLLNTASHPDCKSDNERGHNSIIEPARNLETISELLRLLTVRPGSGPSLDLGASMISDEPKSHSDTQPLVTDAQLLPVRAHALWALIGATANNRLAKRNFARQHGFDALFDIMTTYKTDYSVTNAGLILLFQILANPSCLKSLVQHYQPRLETILCHIIGFFDSNDFVLQRALRILLRLSPSGVFRNNTSQAFLLEILQLLSTNFNEETLDFGLEFILIFARGALNSKKKLKGESSISLLSLIARQILSHNPEARRLLDICKEIMTALWHQSELEFEVEGGGASGSDEAHSTTTDEEHSREETPEEEKEEDHETGDDSDAPAPHVVSSARSPIRMLGTPRPPPSREAKATAAIASELSSEKEREEAEEEEYLQFALEFAKRQLRDEWKQSDDEPPITAGTGSQVANSEDLKEKAKRDGEVNVATPDRTELLSIENSEMRTEMEKHSKELKAKIEEAGKKHEEQEKKILQLEQRHEEMRLKIEHLELDRNRHVVTLREREESFQREKEELVSSLSKPNENGEKTKIEDLRAHEEKDLLISQKEKILLEREAHIVKQDEHILKNQQVIMKKDEAIARHVEEVSAVHNFLFQTLCSNVLLSYRLATDVDMLFDKQALLQRLTEMKIPVDEWTNEILIAIEKHNARLSRSSNRVKFTSTTHFKTFL